MIVTRVTNGEVVDLIVEGRLDGYWADHLDAALTEVVREGHHRVRLDCANVSFLTSASIGILVKFHNELSRIHGTFRVINPSPRVSAVLKMTRLTAVLVEPADAPAAVVAPERRARRVDRDDVGFDIFDLDTQARLTRRTIGTAAPLARGAFTEQQSVSLASPTPTFAIGVGAFGDSFADCRARFGELISVSGAAAYQPADGTNVADYLLATGALASDVRVLYGLACEGAFSHLIRFGSADRDATVGLTSLITTCLDATAADSIGIVIVAEAAGLVGAALRRSPVGFMEGGDPPPAGDDDASPKPDLFTHPGIRTRLSFTAEPAFPGSVAVVAGIVSRAVDPPPVAAGTRPIQTRPSPDDDQLRPVGADLSGHLHAAAFRFRPIEKGLIDYAATVTGLFESGQLMGVLHLLHDDRGPSGVGESQFIRGACWVGGLK